ncbi:MAG: DUF2244 domain-containing protein [Gammaproteobacteria bacterium]
MVIVSIDDKGLNGHILLQPNLSLSWSQNAHFLSAVFLALLGIAVYFSSLLGWLVLPYSGLAFILLAVSLYLFFRQHNYQEVIRFSEDRVIIERGKNKPEKTWVYQRQWSKFYIHSQGTFDSPKICLVSHGKELELGAFLGYDEKLQLIENLKQITFNFQRQF